VDVWLLTLTTWAHEAAQGRPPFAAPGARSARMVYRRRWQASATLQRVLARLILLVVLLAAHSAHQARAWRPARWQNADGKAEAGAVVAAARSAGPGRGKTAVVFRTKGVPRSGLLQRLERWRGALPWDMYDVWVSSDETSKLAGGLYPGHVTRMVEPDVWLHTYAVRDMAAAYPVLVSLDTLCRNTGSDKPNWCMWPRVFQTEAVLLWWRAAGDYGYRTVWVVQDDVEYTGDLPSFLGSFNDSVDFVAPETMVLMGPRWPWRNIATYQDGKPLWFASEGVRRYSAPFLDRLEAMTVRGESAWSEAAAPTVCRATHCTWATFPASSLSQRFDHMSNEGVPLLTMSELQKLTRISHDWQNVWVHKVSEDSDKPSGLAHKAKLLLPRLGALATMATLLGGRRWLRSSCRRLIGGVGRACKTSS
jgi:hypothetical protein